MQTLLKTKFFLPVSSPHHVERTPLLDRFDASLSKGLVLVSASAGSGKSTFVSNAISRFKQDTCWISLDEQDADIKRFISLLIAGLQLIRANFGLNTEAMLQSSTEVSIDQILISFINELSEVELETYLVLDDLHVLDSKEIDEAISFVIEHKPSHIKLILISREDPSIPLARLRARNELGEFRQTDLRFTERDVVEFLVKKIGLDLSESQISKITNRTEGWIAGLQLLAMSLQHTQSKDDFINSFSGNQRFVLDYLIEEVIEQLDIETKTFIFSIANLPKFSASLCNKLLDLENSQGIIQELNRQNLFLIALDDHGNWYRFHHLFAQVLSNHSFLSNEDHLKIIANASKWFFEQNYLIEAIDMSIAAKAYLQSILYLEQAWPQMNEQAHEAQLISWLKEIPDEVILQSASISTYYAIALLSVDFQKGCDWLEKAEIALSQSTLVETSKTHSLQGLIEVGRSYQAIAQGQIEEVLKHTQNALSLLDQGEHVWRSAADILSGLMYWHSAEIDLAEQAIRKGHNQLKKTNDYSAIFSSAYLLANTWIVQGRRQEATAFCMKHIRKAKKLDYVPQGYADLYVTLAWLEIGKYDLEQAKSYLSLAYDLGETAMLSESAHNWYVIKALLAAEEGDFLEAEGLLDEAREVKKPSPAPDFAPIDLWEARLNIMQGHLSAAENWAKEFEKQETLSINDAFLLLTLARLRLAQFSDDQDLVKIDQAIELLENLEQQVKMSKQFDLLVEISLLLSRLFLIKNDSKMATEKLGLALDQNEAVNQLYLFIDLFKDHIAWLSNTIQSLPNAQWLLKSIPLNAKSDRDQTKDTVNKLTSSHSPALLIDPLSVRELEVLNALKSDLSGPEIADSLFVSLNTLRTHTKSIYSKLAVNNRRSAIRKAIELNL